MQQITRTMDLDLFGVFDGGNKGHQLDLTADASAPVVAIKRSRGNAAAAPSTTGATQAASRSVPGNLHLFFCPY